MGLFGTKKLVTFKDYICDAMGRSRFYKTNSEMLVDQVGQKLEGVRSEREFDRIIEQSGIEDRLETFERLSEDKFEDAIEKMKKDKRIR